jgi:hypothetical protein
VDYILKHYNGLFARDIMDGVIILTKDVGDAHIFHDYEEANKLIVERNMSSFEICKTIDINNIL